MSNNDKQKILSGFENITPRGSIEDLVHDLISRRGLATLSEELGIDKAQLSRFRSGEGALTLEAVEKIVAVADAVVIPRQKYLRIIQALITANDLLKEAIS